MTYRAIWLRSPSGVVYRAHRDLRVLLMGDPTPEPALVPGSLRVPDGCLNLASGYSPMPDLWPDGDDSRDHAGR